MIPGRGGGLVRHTMGLMSGTSLDGLDGVLVQWSPAGQALVLAHHHQAFPSELRAELLALSGSGPDEIDRSARATHQLGRLSVAVVQALLHLANLAPSDVTAIGSHGQTVRHQPDLPKGLAYTTQLNPAPWIAEHTGIAVVADFRSRDVAAGGQGAPLVPAFHASVFARPDSSVAVLNLGGIANVSLIGPGGQDVTGFDCGPANVLMDQWVQRHLGTPFDHDGTWAASAAPDAGLVQDALAHPFFALPPPKSTGREDFHRAWLDGLLATRPAMAPATVQASLLAITTRSVTLHLHRHAPNTRHLLVCGGGALNRAQMAALQAALPTLLVKSTAEAGLPPLQVEAAAFAWLARQWLLGLPGNVPGVTGARGFRILGALYPA